MKLVEFKRHDTEDAVYINPALVAMVESSGSDDVTDIVVAAQAGLALVRVKGAINAVVEKLLSQDHEPRPC